MPFANATNRRVAAHLPQGLDVVAQQQGFATHARSGQCGLGAGMAAANDDHVEMLWVKHGGQSVRDGSGQARRARAPRRSILPAHMKNCCLGFQRGAIQTEVDS